MKDSKISWTDSTFNPWIGCSKVHTGCTNCYAEADMDKRRGRVQWGPNGTRSMTKTWGDPVKWNKSAAITAAIYSKCKEFDEAGLGDGNTFPYKRPRVFCASLADVFEDWEGPILDHNGHILVHANGQYEAEITEQHESCSRVTMDDLRADLFKLIDATPNLDWLLLTKRPENIRKMWPELNEFTDEQLIEMAERQDITPRIMRRENVWLGTSVSDQETAEKAIPELLKCRDLSPCLFLSVEPLIGPVELPKIEDMDWVIIGGESGHEARPCNIEWIRSVASQCKEAGVPCFVKQLGTKPHCAIGTHHRHPEWVSWLDLKDKKGADPAEWPEDLRVQQFPTAR